MLAAPHIANKTIGHLKAARSYNLCGKSISSYLKTIPVFGSKTIIYQVEQRLKAFLRSFPNPEAWLVGGFLILVGVLLGLSLAPASSWWIAWVAIAPLWILCSQSHTRTQAAIWSGCWGVGYHGAALSWIFGLHPLTWLGIPWVVSLAITILAWGFVTIWGACLAILWAIGLKSLSSMLGPVSRIIIGATLWCGLEWLWSLSPLWWTDLANSQSPHNSAILHLSQMSGPITITLSLMLVNGALAEAWLSRGGKGWCGAIALGLCLHILGWGLAQGNLTPNPTEAISIGMIQGNLPTRFKLSPLGIKQSVEVYRQGYETLADQGVDAVLLPEGALPLLWRQSLGREQPILDAVRDKKVPLWVGTFVPNGESYTQSLLSLQPNGTVLSQYNKVKLVPLGEYLPFESVLAPILRRLSPMRMGMVPGIARQQFDTPLGRAIVGICYDSVFSELFRSQAAAGGQFILSIANNDPYSYRMMAQHHALDTIRAIESDRWLVRVTNTGLSAVIDPHGQTLWKSSINQSLAHIAKIERRKTKTLYVRFGNWLLPMMGVLSIGICLKAQMRTQTNETPNS